MSKIGVLDGIRGLAALMVLWAHFPQVDGGVLIGYFQQASRVFYAGYLGVDIFFALSGFLITRILLQEKQSGTLSFSRFYLKRSLRIFPLYYLVILLVGLFISWEKLGWSAMYLSNYYFSFDHSPNALRHTWSLCVEEHFYLFWPFVISLLSLANSRIFIGCILPVIALVGAVIALMVSPDGIALVNKSTHIRILTLSLGSLLAFHEVRLKSISKSEMQGLILICSLLLFALCCSHFYSDQRIVALSRFITSAGLSFVFLIVMLGFQFTEPKRLVVRIFLSPLLGFIGKISYGLYLFHLPILFYFNVSHMNDSAPITLQSALSLLTMCIVIPIVSYYGFEKPMLYYKKYFFETAK